MLAQRRKSENDLWVRPAEMWFELVEVDGKQIRRFEPMDE